MEKEIQNEILKGEVRLMERKRQESNGSPSRL
jgi:hypothetical protein